MEYFFDSIFQPYIAQNKYEYFCEIGASKGKTTDKLLQIHPKKHVIIDPCIDCDLVSKYMSNDSVTVYTATSLQILHKLSNPFDCIFIDGDHNWYTVYNELKTINENKLLNPGGTIFLHDLSWPYGRRDMYYLPETIPACFRHPYEKNGIIKGKNGLFDKGHFKDFLNAVFEGGEQNGVLTAVEDFLKEFGHEFMFFYHKKQWGLGFLIKKKNFLTCLVFVKWMMLCRCNELSDKLKTTIKKILRRA